MTEPSKACCTIPPVVAKDYEPKGHYATIGGLKTYHTTSTSPRASILFIYDIFGYYPQTVQGADILAQAGNFAVYMPDWFAGEYADISWYPPNTPAKAASLKALFSGRGSTGVVGPRVTEWIREVRGKEAQGGKWGIVGLCWGGKVAALASAGPEAGGFSCAAMAHPAMVDPADAGKISIPFAVLASKDEDAGVVQSFGEALKGKRLVETFGDQVHGWMGARGNLEDGRCREEYERGYKMLTEFFGENLA